MKKKKPFTLNDDLLIELFEKFSSAMTIAAINETQRAEALIIAQVLWLYFITQHDSEKNIYEILYLIAGKNKEKAHGLMTIYYKIMKGSLTRTEKIGLYNHYKCSNNFNRLEKWGISKQKLDFFR